MGIEFKNVSYNQNGNEIIKNLSLKFISNEINSIYDIDGNGELILNLLNGKIDTYDGSILLNKKNLKKSKLSQDMVCLDSVINMNQLVKDYLISNLQKYNYKLDILDKHVLDSLKMVGLDKSVLLKKIDELSSGQIMLIKIASLLSLNPKILVMYEPTNNLDVNGIKNLIKIVRILKNRFHKTFIFISTDVEFLHKISDTIYLINNGRLVKYGDKYDIFTDFDLLKQYNIKLPNTILFSKQVLDKKNKKIGYRDEINDLLKDIYRYAR